ncbi:MAG: ribosome small subunit-dependent GTPase A [Blastochloris sp.]|nr:ribosome small subunit-dependent GTPase A [Blastochloris sp.]
MQGRVLCAHNGFYWVQTEAGVLQCRLRGRLKKQRQAADIAVIGDEVEVEQVAPGEGAVSAVLERHSRFSRQQPGPRGQWKEDILIANLDQVCIVFSCASPPFNSRMLDRFLVVAEYNEIAPVIIANKTDLVSSEEALALFRPYEDIGYTVLRVSAQTNEGIVALREKLAGSISVFTGRSGVGKSSLLNVVEPGLHLRTGDVSQALDKGRHTTVYAELIPLAGAQGGYVADTPGIRELANWRIPDEELDWCFREMRPFLGQCEFNDCTHIHEPGCALRDAIEQGRITHERYESYTRQLLKMER